MLKVDINERNVWVTSDTHFSHKNIVRGISNWDDKRGCRDFDTLDKHDYTILKNINDVVGEDDILFHLGDFSFSGHENVRKFREQIICKEIHYILGNHDQYIEPLNSRYRELFSSVQHYKEVTFINGSDKKHVIMCHYAMDVWNNHHKGSIMLFGHSHSTLAISHRKKMDVGVDTNNLKPYNIHEIFRIMNKRVVEFIDHHDNLTT